MKKVLGIVLSLASLTFVATSAEAAPNVAGAGQVRVELGQSRRNRQRGWRNRVVTTTRIVQRGRHRYRETYQVTYRPNGGTVTRLISRVRIW
jgi:hypothetical protein